MLPLILCEMGSYANLARRALETEMPIMVQVLKDASPSLTFFFLSLEFDLFMCIWIGDLGFEVCVCLCLQMQEVLRGAKNCVSLAQVCFIFFSLFPNPMLV